MAVIYLTHPIHGAKVAISEDEAIFDENYGWERYDPTADIETNPVNEMASRPRGRPRQAPQED